MTALEIGERASNGGNHLLSELGFTVRRAGAELFGTARVVPEMHASGTSHLRTSIVAAWADTLTGLLAAGATNPRVPVTLDLDVHLLRPSPGSGLVEARATVAKAGRAVLVATVEFSDSKGAFAAGAASFTLAPDAGLRLPDITSLESALPPAPTISVPFAERAGCRREQAGTAVQPRLEDGLNSSRTVNGGLLALVAEEAALSLVDGATLSSLHLRYLRPVRVGPARAIAHVEGGLALIEITDDGADDRVAVLATARFFAAEQR